MRLDGHSSNLFSYFIPENTGNMRTSSIQISVKSENPYTPIEMYLSIGKTIFKTHPCFIDEELYQIEDRSNDMVADLGKTFRF